MLLTLSLTFYAALSGATFARLIRYLDLIDQDNARAKWLLLSLLGACLWPLVWAVWIGLAWLARREANR